MLNTKNAVVLFLLLFCGQVFAASIAEVEYFYSLDGTLIGRAVNGKRLNYEYDLKGQLLAVKDTSGKVIEQYVYDPAGNILSKTIESKTTTFTYDEANQLVSSTCEGKTTTYEYDAAGRLVREGSKTYSYGYLDKILEVQENGKQVAAFDYHVDGQVASATYSDKSESFVWDGLALIQRNENTFINEPHVTGGNPILSSEDGVMFNDMLGNTLSVNGKTVDMTAFGETTDKEAMFTGKPYIGELGYAFLFRNYRADNGKWQTADPLGYPDGWNQLAYCTNQFSHIDPLGLSDSFDDYNLSKLSSSDYGFVKHFYTGKGDDVTLSKMGIFSAIQNEIGKQQILNRFQSQVDGIAHDIAKRSDCNGPLSGSFINSYNFINASYSIGKAVLSGTFSGKITISLLDDGTKRYGWSGTTTLTFSDDFTDPLSVIELVYGSSTSPNAPEWLINIANLGGDRFHVGEKWSISMSGGGIIE